jgi:hypothetical protein
MYDLKWAENVVKQHYTLHARVSYFLHIVLDITTNDLAKWVAKRDPRWEAYKKVAKIFEDHSAFSATDPSVSYCLSEVDKMVHLKAVDGSKWLLTRLQASSMLKKQFVERRAEPDSRKSRADLPGQLLFDM